MNKRSASLDWITSTKSHQSLFFVCWNVMSFDHANQSWNSTWTQSWWKHDCNFVWNIRTESLMIEKTSYEVMRRAWFWVFVEINDCSEEHSKRSMWKRAFEEDEKMSQNSCFEIATRTIKRNHFIFEKLVRVGHFTNRTIQLLELFSDDANSKRLLTQCILDCFVFSFFFLFFLNLIFLINSINR
jgi:hypothetical protein